jgi:pimeloyl-ACP methyl ester carboxylesterase
LKKNSERKVKPFEPLNTYFKSGSGPLLIYLPGMEGTGRLFYRQEPELRTHYTVACLPSRAQPPFTYPELIDDVLNVMKQEQAGKATIVAESFGGTVALQFAAQHPERIDRLVLINTFPYFRRRIRLYLGLILLPFTFIPLGNAIREFFYKMALGFERVEKEDIAKLCECSFSHGYGTSRNRMRLVKDLDVRNQLSKISVPVTIIASAQDKLIPSVKEARWMASQLPDARVIVLPEHGHTPLVTSNFSLLSVLT